LEIPSSAKEEEEEEEEETPEMACLKVVAGYTSYIYTLYIYTLYIYCETMEKEGIKYLKFKLNCRGF
jgi:hypothetical protein